MTISMQQKYKIYVIKKIDKLIYDKDHKKYLWLVKNI